MWVPRCVYIEMASPHHEYFLCTSELMPEAWSLSVPWGVCVIEIWYGGSPN